MRGTLFLGVFVCVPQEPREHRISKIKGREFYADVVTDVLRFTAVLIRFSGQKVKVTAAGRGITVEFYLSSFWCCAKD